MKALKVLLFLIILLMAGRSACQGQPSRQGGDAPAMDAEAVVMRNIRAAGGAERLEAVRSLSFRWGIAAFTAAGRGRLKVQYALAPPAVYETLVVDEKGVRRNRLGRIAELAGNERDQWRALARLVGGGFTLKNFRGSLAYGGVKAFGPERYHVLSTTAGSLRGELYVDGADFLVKRLVLAGVDEDGGHWETCHELGGFAPVGGVQLPGMMFAAQVGEGGTYGARPRPITEPRLGDDPAVDFFTNLSVNAGQVGAGPGWLEGNVLDAHFDDDLFVMIFTNWTEEDARRAGWRDGDLLVLASGGAEFETRFYFTEDKADPAHKVYDPGNSLFTHNPRIPLFYAQFNTCAPREKFDLLKAGFRLLEPIRGRKKE